ncbi:hypothetical protein C8J56DRAFT_954517 [Mycena floridula]|nr:hypothetical protein C8J56DRAFT_954517 [Mycena floridula]
MPSASESSGGLFSNVLSYVSKEFDSFITNATGGTISATSNRQPQKRVKRTKKASSTGPSHRSERASSSSHTDQPGRHSRSPKNTRTDSRSLKPQHRPEQADESVRGTRRRVKSPPEDVSEDSSPPPLPRVLRRRPSITMPGSLFPRSPSMDRESVVGDEPEHHVRFAPGISSPPHSKIYDRDTPHSRSSSSLEEMAQVKSFCPPSIPSVKSAVERFHVRPHEADPSILLPQSSPPRLNRTRASDESSRHEEAPRIPYNLKGKARASTSSIELLEGDTSGEVRVKGKERELVAAREEQMRNEKRWERDKDLHLEQAEAAQREKNQDKEKIRMLEEEIQHLKAQLSNRPSFFPPPPPAPPPPPLGGHRPPSALDQANPFSSARAALKHGPSPAEAPINPPVVRRQGQPTFGVPADKMAAFLTEMKTKRLRKVSETAAGPRDFPTRSTSVESRFSSSSVPATSQGLTKRIQSLYTSSTALSRSTGKFRAPDENTRTGEKRKRFDHEPPEFRGDPGAVPKRRSFGSVDSEMTTVSASSSAFPPSDSVSVSSSSFPFRMMPQIAKVSDASTPSLSSDNERDVSQDEPPPSTPPVVEERASIKTAERNDPEYINVDMDPSASPPSPPRNRRISSEAFAKRAPGSPLPAPSPRKPRPPTSRPRSFIKPIAPPELSDDEDPLSMRFTPPADTTKRSGGRHRRETPESSRHGSTSTVGKKDRRRKTLDEELRTAFDERATRDDAEDDDVESGTLVGVGTKSKRKGFLARGGAGGEPVFMGIGYVEGAEEDSMDDDDAARTGDDDDEDEYQPKKRPQKSRRGKR